MTSSRSLALLALLALVLPTSAWASNENLLRDGQRIFREGLLPSGDPVTATLRGDIEIDGRMFTCSGCHLRSGLGSDEGTVITPPINGSWLTRPLPRGVRNPEYMSPMLAPRERPAPAFDPGHLRTAFDDESLAATIRSGSRPGGQPLSDLMPRFQLDDYSMKALMAYLLSLNPQLSPGVNDKVLTFATVVSSDLPAEQRKDMVDVLAGYIRTYNNPPRHRQRRAENGPFYRREMDTSYRKLELMTWELQGPRSGWQAQLENYQRQRPAFALLGGMVSGDWRPVHEFCEKNRIPALFPFTDRPVQSDDWYTMYFSRGLQGEGETAARYAASLADDQGDAGVLQIYRANSDGAVAARGFSRQWAKLGLGGITDHVLATTDALNATLLQQLLQVHQPGTLLLWLEADDVAGAGGLDDTSLRPALVLASGTLLEGSFATVPAESREWLRLTWPRAGETDKLRTHLAISRWITNQGMQVKDFHMQSAMYFIGWMLSGNIMNMGNDFYRDYFLDSIDMMVDQDYAVASWPRLSFGPGQRYASKGCYVARLSAGDDPRPEPLTGWVVR